MLACIQTNDFVYSSLYMFGHLGNSYVYRVIGAGAKDREVGIRVDIEVNYVDVSDGLECRRGLIPGPVWGFGPWNCRLGIHGPFQRFNAGQEDLAVYSLRLAEICYEIGLILPPRELFYRRFQIVLTGGQVIQLWRVYLACG
jgi:hypothetical protein